MDKRSEMREFLISRRAKVRPEDLGLPAGSGRRLPGLRREELATMAGVSISYYTRLERGDATGVSQDVLDAISRTLKLDDVERAHLDDLARAVQGGPATRRTRRRPTSTSVRPALQQMIDQMPNLPVVVQNRLGDVVATNQLGRALYAAMFAMPGRPANHSRFIHLDPRSRDFYLDWDQIADYNVAMLRVAAGRDPYDRELSDMIGELATRSEDFRARWGTHDVHEHRSGIKRVHHEIAGDLELTYEAMDLPADRSLQMVVYSAEPASPSHDALRLLASWAAPSTTVPLDRRSGETASEPSR